MGGGYVMISSSVCLSVLFLRRVRVDRFLQNMNIYKFHVLSITGMFCVYLSPRYRLFLSQLDATCVLRDFSGLRNICCSYLAFRILEGVCDKLIVLFEMRQFVL